MREIVCIGSVLWDVIGRTRMAIKEGSDVPGHITRLPGGVAMNVALTLRRFQMTPVLLTTIGRDAEGDDLIAACQKMGMVTEHIHRSDDLRTDLYMAIEGPNGLMAAIADAHSLEAVGDQILHPLENGALGSADAPYSGRIVLDGNLTETLLAEISSSPVFKAATLSVAPASPGKAKRLRPLLATKNATLYVNLEEAGLLCETRFTNAPAAALTLMQRGAAQVLVTDGANVAAHAGPDGLHSAQPPQVQVQRVTGAGDTCMAAHIASLADGANTGEALERALAAAAAYVAGDTP